MLKGPQKRDTGDAAPSAPLRRRAPRAPLDGVSSAAGQLGGVISREARTGAACVSAGGAARRTPQPFFAALSSRGARAAPAAAPAATAPARSGGGGSLLGLPFGLLFGGVRLTAGAAGSVAGLALLPLRLLPMPRRRSAPAPDGGSGSGSASPPLSREARERAGHALRAKAAKEELAMLWSYTNAAERARVTDFFACFSSPRWRLEEVRDNGTEVRLYAVSCACAVLVAPLLTRICPLRQVWRLPGDRIHCIMGVADVAAAPSKALELFEDPKAVFTRVFPRVDTMFIRGAVLSSARGGFAVCRAVFKLPALVGNGAAAGFPPRDFVWTQYVTKLRATGNVLVTARSADGAGPDAAAARADPRCPPASALPPPGADGAVRGRLLTSGYYGRREGPAKSRVFYIAQADPGGILPAWLVNFAAGKQAANVTRLAAMFRNGKLLE